MGAYSLQNSLTNVTYGEVTKASYGLSTCTPIASGLYRMWCRAPYSGLFFVPSSGVLSALEVLLAGSNRWKVKEQRLPAALP